MPIARRLLMLILTALGASACQTDDGAEAGVATVDPRIAHGGFREVVQQALPAIVFIQTEATLPAGIERLFPGMPPPPDEPVPMGMGSGVLFTSDGYILTNNHVVQDADRVRVMLQDRRHFEAEVVGRDPSTDVAVVRIPGSGYPVADFGDSETVEIGDWVLALGSPLGLQFSVTAGVVSGTGRAIGILAPQVNGGDRVAPLEHFIQTDAALSPGNSGGPLVNTAGQVVGINTAVAAPPGVPASVGFAIPVNLARLAADQLIRYGEVRRAYLGVSLVDITPVIAASEGLERVQGAAVAGVESGGPADSAGIQPRDVIIGIAGQPVQTVSDLQNQLVRLEPGSTVNVRVLRQGREVDLGVELGMIRGRAAGSS